MLYDKRWDLKPESVVELEPWQSVLLRAADVIEQHGWCQNSCRNWHGNFCAIGALQTALDNLPMKETLGGWLKAERALKRTIRSSSIPGWNDRRGRTKEEVIAALREAAQI